MENFSSCCSVVGVGNGLLKVRWTPAGGHYHTKPRRLSRFLVHGVDSQSNRIVGGKQYFVGLDRDGGIQLPLGNEGGCEKRYSLDTANRGWAVTI